VQNKKTKGSETKSTDRSDLSELSGKAISLFFMVNSMKELLETPQSIMPTQAIAKRYVELRGILKEVQPESTKMIPEIDPEGVKIEELRIGFQMMFAACIPFILDYSQQFKELLDAVQTFQPSNAQSQDFLSAHRDLIFALGLGEEWASAALFLSLLEIMINEKLVQLGESRDKVNDMSFQTKVKDLSSKASDNGAQINSLFAESFYKIRNRVLHEGRSPNSDELQSISSFVHKFYQSITQIK
jgi:hypothetical protein